jgi:hypothetical protein
MVLLNVLNPNVKNQGGIGRNDAHVAVTVAQRRWYDQLGVRAFF